MLTSLNNYVQGYFSIPVILTCKKHGLFRVLDSVKPLPFTKLVKELRANSGHLRVVLRMLESLKWVYRNSKDEYLLTNESDIHHKISEDTIKLMSFPMNDYINTNQKRHRLRKWIDLSTQRWNIDNSVVANFLDGLVVIPLLLALKENNLLSNLDNQESSIFKRINSIVKDEVTELFINLGWLSQENGSITFTDAGRFIKDENSIDAVIASCKPVLANISEVIFGDCEAGFKKDLSDSTLVAGCAMNMRHGEFQDENYLSDIEEIIFSIFDRKPYKEQPKYIVNIGSGDGILLKKIYETIKNKTLRGKVLNQYPIKLIEIDLNETALDEVTHRLQGIDHIVLKADSINPVQVIADLKTIGIQDVGEILHIHSFVDHSRPYIPPTDISAENARSNILSEAVYVDRSGNIIPPKSVIQSLVEHLKSWSSVIGRHGLIIMEVHCVGPATVSKYLDKCESLYFDAYHSFSHQLLIEADKFLVAAAETGLFPNQDFFRKYPKMLPFSQMTINQFEKREYKIRYAHEMDLPALEELEKKCWEPDLQRPICVLRERLKQYPQGQLVLDIDNKVVGSIYSQRIINWEELKSVSFETVESLHRNEGAVVQLLTVNVLPELQNRNLGDQLLEFMLQLCSLMDGIHKIVAVTKCKDYHKYTYATYQEYIKMRNEQGRLVDTILRFHELHGAHIGELVPNYRPQDRKNGGNGVLVEYDVYNRHRNAIQINSSDVENDVTAVTSEKSKIIENFIIRTIASLLGTVEENSFSLRQPLMEMGLDSGDLLDLNEQISSEYKTSLKSTFFFEYNTAERVITYLQEHIDLEKNRDVRKIEEIVILKESDQENSGTSNDNAKVKYNSSSPQKKEIAIIGVACRLPGGIRNKEQLWDMLTCGKEAISKMPSCRFDWPNYIDPDNKHKGIDLGGFLDDIAHFDSNFFRISPKEAKLMDPQQRILMELSWECLEDAGYSAKAVSGSKTGVYIGASGSDYNRLLDRHLEEIEAHYGIGTSMAVLANRISYFYDFCGPSIQIDTACSSSLIAIHEAVKSLQEGECEQAIVGGINIICHPATSIAFYKAGMLAKDGRCKTFDKEANGYVRGEGAVMMLLKPLEKALYDQDSILAVIKGTAINHGGQASGLTVPNPIKQAALLMEAFKAADFDPETVSYIEAHGTGTSLGDPIEISGLKEAFSQYSKEKGEPRKTYCGLGSIKTNIGHLEAAAGIAGLLKVVLSMRNQTLPASLNFKKLNPHIDFTETPFYIVDRTQPWQGIGTQSLRRAGVSSFGSGGANAHVVLEEAPAITRNSKESFSCYMIGLSAQTEDALRQKERDLAQWLKKEGQHNNLGDISANLLCGREHFACRATYVVRDSEELYKKIMAVFEKGQVQGYFRENSVGKIKLIQPLFEELGQMIVKKMYSGGNISEQEYENQIMALAELYAKGYDLDWKAMYRDRKIVRLGLPTYPFARECYWVSDSRTQSEKDIAATSSAVASEFIHPLLHQNTGGTLVDKVESKKSELPSLGFRQILEKVTATESISDKPKGISLLPLSGDRNLSGSSKQAIILPVAGVSFLQQRDNHESKSMKKAISIEVLQEELKTSLAEALYLKQNEIDINEKFIEMGLDSIIGVEWIRVINKKYATAIAATKVYDYPSIFEFTEFLATELNKEVSLNGSNSINSVSDQPSKKILLQTIELPEKGSIVNSGILIPEAREINSSAELLKEGLITSLAEALYMKRSEVDVDKNFIDMGLDSIIGVEWIRAINKKYATAIAATKVYDYPNIREFADFMEDEINKQGQGLTQSSFESTVVLSMDEILRQVYQGKLDVKDADQLIQKIYVEGEKNE